ncbi:odorant receptor 13a-like [Venturia canescens]|uniref:odorant receptor 13a-like n=1 Tax=Venturia canescens TaxID=32260 RepID=UPI001C9D4B74|nr:odorant receptor 13a-like [Venturia canescens]
MTVGLAIMTNVFEERYYRINKKFLILIGVWPYLSQPVRKRIIILISFLAVSQVVPQIIAVSKVLHDWDVAVESIPPFVIEIGVTIKMLTFTVNIKKLHRIMEHIRMDWLSLAGQPELQILREYAENGRKLTIVYSTGIYVAAFLFLTQPTTLKILQVINFLNDSIPTKYPFPVDYYVLDMDVYYFYFLPHTYICIGVILTVLIAEETLFFVQVQHGCAMFSVLGSQLQRMDDNVTDDWTIRLRPLEDPAFAHLCNCIRNHNDVIEFSDLLESIYSPALFSSVMLAILLISVTGFQGAMVMEEKPTNAIRYMVFTGAQLFYLFFESYFCQKLMDHSQQVRQYLSEAKWYRITLHAQKLLPFISMRTLTPCQLTAGKIIVMSLETYTSVVKTSMSYFTLLRSMQ